MGVYTIYDKIREYDERVKEMEKSIAFLRQEVDDLAAGLKHFAAPEVMDHELAEDLLEKYHIV